MYMHGYKMSLVATACCLKKKKSNRYSADRCFFLMQPVYLRKLRAFLYSFIATISSPVACLLAVRRLLNIGTW